MAFLLPTLAQLIERTQSDLNTQAADALRRSDQATLARVHAGASHEMHSYLGWVAEQILPDSCDEAMLLRLARLRLSVPRKEAARAFGQVRAHGTEEAMIDAGVLLQTDDGRHFTVTSSAKFLAERVDVSVCALEAGAQGNTAAGTSMRFISPIRGVADTATVGSRGLSGGADQESLERLRARVIRSFRIVPHGGAAHDYETWALEIPGVTRAWAKPNYLGLGTVGVFFVCDDAQAPHSPIPSPHMLSVVAAHLEALRPVTAEVHVLAPKLRTVDFEIRLTPDDRATREAVQQSLSDLLTREGELGALLLESHIREAISGAPGEHDHTLYAPRGDVVLQPNELAAMGTLSWR